MYGDCQRVDGEEACTALKATRGSHDLLRGWARHERISCAGTSSIVFCMLAAVPTATEWRLRNSRFHPHIPRNALVFLVRHTVDSVYDRKETTMVTSVILVNVERSRINETAEKLAGLDGVSEVYSVSGEYDLVAIARVRTNEELSDLVTNRLLKIESIAKTTTMLAFKAYSRHDLETMFMVGA
jgi:DNA-binding Lrp family transcriptional regulator